MLPFVLEGRILQSLCNQNLPWDMEVTDDVKKEWNKFITRLKHVDELYVRRCIRPDDFWKISDISMHHFSDASEQGYGQCSYIRMVDEEGQIHCSLLLGKSRVVPKKFVSIPRLELTAAVLSVKMACLLKKELNLGEVTHYFWTDSKVVLGYIRNNTRRFKTFVANRIHQIKENTHAEQWSYIPTRENPADDASRGLNAEWESSNSRWFQGLSFLWQEEKHWPNQDESVELAADDPELKRETKSLAAAVVQQEDVIEYLEERISNWSKFKRIIALLLCYKRKLLQHIRSKKGWKGANTINCNDRLFNLEELKRAEKEVIKSVQQRHFKEEIMALHNRNSLKSSSKIIKSDPFLDQDGILENVTYQRKLSIQFYCRSPVKLLT